MCNLIADESDIFKIARTIIKTERQGFKEHKIEVSKQQNVIKPKSKVADYSPVPDRYPHSPQMLC